MKDLELHRWFFFTLRPELQLDAAENQRGQAHQRTDFSEKGFPLPEQFSATLAGACDILKIEPALAITRQHIPILETFVRLIPDDETRWRDVTQHEEGKSFRFGVAIDAGVFNDVVFVCTSAGYKDKDYEAETQIKALRGLLYQRSASGAQFLGEMECWAAEAAADADLGKKLQQLWQDIEGSGDFVELRGESVQIRFAIDRESCCMVYHAGANGSPQNRIGVLRVKQLPLIGIQRLKIRSILKNYQQVYIRAVKIENDLEQLMRACQSRLGLAQVEQLSQEIAQHQKKFIEQVSVLEVYLETLELTQKNLHRLLRSGGLQCVSQEAHEQLFLAEKVDNALEQIRAHLRYLAITRSQAELSLESLNTAASVRNAQWSRAIAIFGSPFAAASVAEAFQEELEHGWIKLVLIVVLTLTFWLLTGVIREWVKSLHLWLRRQWNP